MTGVIKAAVQPPSKIEINGVLNKDTGFPEPLSPYSNTTLRHPSADTSPNACIENTDAPASRTTHTRNPSFQLRSSKRPTASGSLLSPATASGLPSNATTNTVTAWTDGTGEDEPAALQQQSATGVAAAGSTTGVNPAGQAGGAEEQHGYGDGEQKRGFLRKMVSHKA